MLDDSVVEDSVVEGEAAAAVDVVVVREGAGGEEEEAMAVVEGEAAAVVATHQLCSPQRRGIGSVYVSANHIISLASSFSFSRVFALVA